MMTKFTMDDRTRLPWRFHSGIISAVIGLLS
jgi:hypothetical protein